MQQSLMQQPTARARWFYFVAAILSAVLGFLGFQLYYLQGLAYPGREIPPPIRTLVIVHAAAMSAWLVLLVAQTLLIRLRMHRLHMTIGKVGIALAAVILVTGLMVGLRSAAVTPAEIRIWGLAPKAFLAVPVVSIVLFAVLVVLGVVWRRKPQLHRSMMLLATLTVLSAAVSRIDALSNLYIGSVWEQVFGPFFFTLCFAVLLVVLRWLGTRSLDFVLGFGVAFLIAASAGIMMVARTDAWLRFATMLVG